MSRCDTSVQISHEDREWLAAQYPETKHLNQKLKNLIEEARSVIEVDHHVE